MGKSLKNSPLMQFVSTPQPDTGKAATPPPAAPEAPKTPAAEERKQERERKRTARENAKYKAAPLLPPDYRASAEGEARSRRVQLLMRPTLYNDLAGIAHRQHTSVNHLLEQVLTEYAEAQRGSK